MIQSGYRAPERLDSGRPFIRFCALGNLYKLAISRPYSVAPLIPPFGDGNISFFGRVTD